MLLRWLVTHFLRQAAEEQMQQFVQDATGQRSGDFQSTDGRVVDGKLSTSRTASENSPFDGAESTGSADDEESELEESPLCDVAIVFALGVESGGTTDMLQASRFGRFRTYSGHLGQMNGRRVLVANFGVGKANAGPATRDAIAIHQPKWVVSAGFAGGLVSELQRGHLLMADHILDGEKQDWTVGLRVPADQLPRNVHVGTLLTVDNLVRTTQEKQELAERYDALACDMETAAVAEACRQAKTRFLSVRIVSDGLDDQLPPEVDKLLTSPHWASKLGAATAAIWNRPSTVKDLWKLKQDALQASDRLAKFLRGVIQQLD